jgi:hypothetical protein
MLPQLLLPEGGDLPIPSAVVDILETLGVTTVENLDGLLKAVSIMRQHVQDEHLSPLLRLLPAFAEIFLAISSVLECIPDPDEARTTVREHFLNEKVILCADPRLDRCFWSVDEVLWDGDADAVKVLGLPTLHSEYGVILEKYFLEVLKVCRYSITVNHCWAALRMLADVNGTFRNADSEVRGQGTRHFNILQEIVSNPDELQRVCGAIYAELERSLQNNPEQFEIDTFTAASQGGVHVLALDLTSNADGRACCKQVVNVSQPVYVNDDDPVFQLVREELAYWIDDEAFSNAPLVREFLKRKAFIVSLSSVLDTRGDIDVAAPTSIMKDWSSWCRQFIAVTYRGFQRLLPLTAQQLVSGLSVMRASMISVTVVVKISNLDSKRRASKDSFDLLPITRT